MFDLDSWWCVCCGKLTQHLTVAWVSSVDVKYTDKNLGHAFPTASTSVFLISNLLLGRGLWGGFFWCLTFVGFYCGP